MPITPLPTPVPSRADPANFAARGDAFLVALPAFANEANELAEEVNANTAICQSAAQTVNVSAWVSGFSYADGANVYDPVTFLTYRRKGAGSGSTRPALDSAGWQLLTGFGNVDLTSAQTLTNKTHGSGSVWAGGAIPVANGGTSQTTAAGIQSILPIAQTRVNVASAATVNLTSSVPSNDHINITGTTPITSFTVAAGRLIFVRFDAAVNLSNNANIITQTGQNISTRGGDTCILRATAANTVEVLSYATPTPKSQAASGYQVLPQGLILQWGTGNTGGSAAISVTFPIAFPSSCYHASAAVNLAGNPNAFMSVSSVSTGSFTAQSSVAAGGVPSIPFLWFAIGY